MFSTFILTECSSLLNAHDADSNGQLSESEYNDFVYDPNFTAFQSYQKAFGGVDTDGKLNQILDDIQSFIMFMGTQMGYTEPPSIMRGCCNPLGFFILSSKRSAPLPKNFLYFAR